MEDKSKLFFTCILLFLNGYILQKYLTYIDINEPQIYLLTPLIITTLSIIIWSISKSNSAYKKLFAKISIVCTIGLILWTSVIMYAMALGKAYTY